MGPKLRPDKICEDSVMTAGLAILGISGGAGWNPVGDYSVGLTRSNQRESADGTPSRRHYADAQNFREPV